MSDNIFEREQILSFIRKFKPYEVKDFFRYGFCYWFCMILMQRFEELSPILMYNPVDNHFAVRIGDYLYDVMGITDPLGFRDWWEWKGENPLESERIKNECIEKNE